MGERGVDQPVVVLGVCGGIAAYKAVEVLRLLTEAGCAVSPILTEAATEFIGPLTFSALAAEPAEVSLYGGAHPSPHTRLGQKADLVVVAPATADLLSRLVAGRSDDLLTATLSATTAPIVVAPAMHTEMWEQASVQANVATLRGRGVVVVDPASGRHAGGDVGTGRLAEPAVIAATALEVLGGIGHDRDLEGCHVLITAGGTREAIDPVRYVSNRSSGKQGYALVEAAVARGARVTLVTAARRALTPLAAEVTTVVEVDSADEMDRAVASVSSAADVVIMAAAVADYRPVASASRKLTKDLGIPTIELEQTADILAGLVSRRRHGQVIVGFAAETHDVLERATAKLARKGCDLLVVNDVAADAVGFDHETNAVVILGADGSTTDVPLAAKRIVAHAVLDRVARLRTTTPIERTPS